MAFFSNRKEHFRQYAKVAGRGNVEVAWTPLTGKLHLKCRVCDEKLTATEPKDVTAIDHSVQEWLRMHAHVGYVPVGYVPNSGKSHIEPMVQAAGGMPDKSIGKSNLINETLKKYQQEIAAKMDDTVLAKKIADLQAVTPEQKAEAAEFFKQQEVEAQAAINKAALFILQEQQKKQKKQKEYQEQAKQDLLNELTLKKAQLQAERAELEGKVEEAKPKPVSALQTKTGRKFR